MRESDRLHVADLLAKAATGSLERSDTVALLIMVRADAAKGSSLKDIGDGIAHHKRDKGTGFRQLQAFSRQLIRTAIDGGDLEARVMYPIDGVIAELASVARRTGVEFDAAAATERSQSLARSIALAVDGTIFTVNKMIRAELRADPHLWVVTPLWDVDGAVLRLYRGVQIAGPLLVEPST